MHVWYQSEELAISSFSTAGSHVLDVRTSSGGFPNGKPQPNAEITGARTTSRHQISTVNYGTGLHYMPRASVGCLERVDFSTRKFLASFCLYNLPLRARYNIKD
jgi:hypothetical protein